MIIIRIISEVIEICCMSAKRIYQKMFFLGTVVQGSKGRSVRRKGVSGALMAGRLQRSPHSPCDMSASAASLIFVELIRLMGWEIFSVYIALVD
jgi:hypothetical protein